MDISQEVTLIIIGCAFLLLVAIGIIILILVYQKKQLRFIYEKKATESAHKEEILKNRIDAQEETLNHVSKEIHDNIAQLVTSAKLMIGSAGRTMPAAGDTLKLAEQALTKAVDEMRALSKSLNSTWLEQFNFFQNLNDEIYRINQSGTVTLSIDDEIGMNMPKERQVILLRMVQEAIQNAIKHGNATHIQIKSEERQASMLVTISDNGKGFDVRDGMKEGFGIINMKHRVATLHGKVNWKSDSTGTVVTIEIPNQGES